MDTFLFFRRCTPPFSLSLTWLAKIIMGIDPDIAWWMNDILAGPFRIIPFSGKFQVLSGFL